MPPMPPIPPIVPTPLAYGEAPSRFCPYGEYADAFWFTVEESVDGLCGIAGADVDVSAVDVAIAGNGGAPDCGITEWQCQQSPFRWHSS